MNYDPFKLWLIRNRLMELCKGNQEGVAVYLGIKQPEVSRLLNGKTELSMKQVLMICSYLEISLEEVIK